MRLEQIPLLIGVLVGILGLGLVLDSWLPDSVVQARERRRRVRVERHRGGETLVGLGILAIAASLVGSDSWRYGTVAVLLGVVLLAAGSWLNREYLSERFAHRGPARRGEKRATPRPVGQRALADVLPPPEPMAAEGLADRPPRRDEPFRGEPIRGDREAPIMKVTEGVPGRSPAVGEDTPPDGRPPLR